MDEPDHPPKSEGKTPDTPQPLVEMLPAPAPRAARIFVGIFASILFISLVCLLLQCIGLWSDRAAGVIPSVLGMMFMLACIAMFLTLKILSKWWRG